MDGVVGLQLCNEADWESPGLYRFYDAALARVPPIDSRLPIYISDAWDLKTALRYSLDKNGIKGSLSNPVIVDTHQYYTFADKDTSRHPQELISQVSTQLLELRDIAGSVIDREGQLFQLYKSLLNSTQVQWLHWSANTAALSLATHGIKSALKIESP